MGAIRRRAAELSDGRLSLLEAGAGPPLVLLHGAPTSAELWRDVLPPLVRAGYRCLAPDLPGYGGTRLRPSADHSLTGTARHLAAWLEAEGHHPVWIVGHDLGGLVGQLMAVQSPQLVGRLSLVNSVAADHWPAPRARISAAAARLGLYRPAARLHVVPNPVVRRQIRRAFADPRRATRYLQDRVVWDTKVSTAAGRDAFQRHLAAIAPHDTADLNEALPRLECPVDLVWGVEDPFQRWDPVGLALHLRLPAARVTLLGDCGHFPPLETPERLAEVLLSER
jgi:2-hydroxymuconate-semialdehyde hydrolase